MHSEQRRDGGNLPDRDAIRNGRDAIRNGIRAATGLTSGLAIALALLLAGAAAGDSEDTPSSGANPVLADVGSTFYRQYCTSCHGMEGRGDGPTAAVLKQKPADLTRIAERRGGEFPSAEIAMYIDGRFEVAAHGSREMPVWGRRFGVELGPGEQTEEVVRGRVIILVEYLKSIQQPAE